MVQNAELTVKGITAAQFDAIDTQNNVLQGLRIEADFSMGDIGIDDHKVIGVDRVELIVDEKLTFSANYIKKLHMIVGMGDGMPVAAIFGAGNI
jgi:hypothetical protein